MKLINNLLNALYSADHKVLYVFMAAVYVFFGVVIYFE